MHNYYRYNSRARASDKSSDVGVSLLDLSQNMVCEEWTLTELYHTDVNKNMHLRS